MERVSHWMAWSVVALIALFCALNWSLLTSPTSLDVLVAEVHAPMGVVLLGLTGVFVALFFVTTLYSRISNLMETRKLHKELRLKQELADRAEASRLDGLQRMLTTEFRQLGDRLAKLESATREQQVKLP